MDFLKRHVFSIACGLATVVGIALAATGIAAMPDVIKQMEQSKALYGQLENLSRKAANSRVIEAERRRIDRMTKDSSQIFAKVTELCSYHPLVPEVLPEGDKDARFGFLRRYLEAMDELMVSLRYGTPPSAEDVQAMSDKIDLERFREQARGLDPGAPAPVKTKASPLRTPAGVMTWDGVKASAAARASIARSQNIYLYAVHGGQKHGPKEVPSLSFYPDMKQADTLEPPYLFDIWWAQVGYWIQKDVVESIVAVNEEAAAAAAERGEDRWVGNMPVKEIISIRLSEGYIVEDDDEFDGGSPGGYKEAIPCATANSVFTGSVSNSTYDVVQYTAKLIMDERDIPLLIDRITKNRFHTLLRVAYESVPFNRAMVGKVYGSEPNVNVVLDFEAIMVAEVFHPLMPQEVCDEYDHITCPEREEPEGE